MPVVLYSKSDPEVERSLLLAQDGQHFFPLWQFREGDLDHLKYTECSFVHLRVYLFTSSDSRRGISTDVAPDMMMPLVVVAPNINFPNCQCSVMVKN